MRYPMVICVAVFLSLSGFASASYADDDPCAAFTWNVAHERALFGLKAQVVAAGQTLAASPKLSTDRLYQLQLKQQSAVSFVAPPERRKSAETDYAGLATLSVDTGAVYRIALDQPAWVDVVANGSLVSAKDFQGRHGCNAPHKIVEFLLPAGTSTTLQISGATTATVRVTVTRSPDGR